MFSFKELKSEWKKITWPGAKEVAKKTGIVIVVCAIFSVVIGIYDVCFNWIMRKLDNIFLK